MKNRLKIVFLPLLFLRSWHTMNAASLSADGTAEIQLAEKLNRIPVSPRSKGNGDLCTGTYYEFGSEVKRLAEPFILV